MQSKPLIYIADPTYDTIMLSNETFPIGIGYVVAYAQKELPDSFTFKLFKIATKLFEAIDLKLPDILALSCFPWNEYLSSMVAEYYKKQKPDGVVIFGGTFLPDKPDGQLEFFKKHSYVDLLVLYDGEFGFLEFLKRYLREDGNNKKIFFGNQLDGSVFWSKEENDLKVGGIIDRPKDINEIPSPYLTGLMDQFFENHLMTPMVQSTRGCPFSCTYCWAGNSFNSKILQFSTDRILSELDYIAKKRKDKINRMLMFADTNFGMYPKDEIIADKIASLQKSYNFPSSLSAACGKNNKDRVIRMLKKINNASAEIGIQSTDIQIQKNVLRKPINIDEYKNIVSQIHALGLRVQSSIILGLPGETRQTHLQTIKDAIYMEIDELSAFTFMMLEGTEFNKIESQEKYNWQKKYRLVPKAFGKYRGKTCFEIETVGVGSNTFTPDDYLYLRGFHGVLTALLNGNLFTEFIVYLRNKGVDSFSFILSFYDELKEERGPAGDQFRNYLTEIKGELWGSKEELIDYYAKDENYQKLLAGEAGDNLLQKYKILTVIENFVDWCEFIYTQSLKSLKRNKEKSCEIVGELNDIKNHILAKGNNILSVENSQGIPYKVSLLHNIYKWRKSNFVHPLSYYKFQKPCEINYVLKDNNRRVVQEILELHSKNKVALLKVLSSRYYLPALFREGSH